MEITPQALEIVTGRSERLNNRAANAYVISGKWLSARRSPTNEGTYFFIRFWVGKVNSCASVTAPLLSVAKTRNCASALQPGQQSKTPSQKKKTSTKNLKIFIFFQ